MRQHLRKKELGQLYPAPAPVKKEEFLKGFHYPKATKREVIVTQIGYIHKCVWVASFLLVLAAVVLGESLFREGTSCELLWSLSAVTPVLAVLVVTETFRSGVYGMAELEMAARYNLPQILLIRMGVIGAVDLLLILFGVPFVVQKGTIGYIRAAVYLMVPYLCTCVLALWVEKYKKGRETVWYCLICGFFVCGINLLSMEFQEIIYDTEKFYIWMLLFVLSVVLLARQIRCIRQEVEEWKWNLYLTE